jgi:hypothetical protein
MTNPGFSHSSFFCHSDLGIGHSLPALQFANNLIHQLQTANPCRTLGDLAH